MPRSFLRPDNPKGLGFGVGWGCDDDPETEVTIMDTEGEISKEFPCFEFQTLADTLTIAVADFMTFGRGHAMRSFTVSLHGAIAEARYSPIAG